LLVAGYFGATQFLSAGSSGVVQPQPAPRSAPPPARANATTPAPQPQQQPQPPNAAPPQQVSTAAAQPQTASAAPAAAASQPTPAAATPQATSPARTATASAPPAATPDTPVRSGFSVQVAAVRTREEGDRMVTRFVTQGYPAYLVRGEGAAASYFRVRIGGFPDRKAAEAVAKQLEGTEGIKGWIVNEVPENKSAAAQTPRKDEHSIGR
jgi:cell division septation protein DedD